MCGDPRDSTREDTFRRQNPYGHNHTHLPCVPLWGSILCSPCPLTSVYQGCRSTDFVQSKSFRLEAKYDCTVEATSCPQTPTPELDGCRDWARLCGWPCVQYPWQTAMVQLGSFLVFGVRRSVLWGGEEKDTSVNSYLSCWWYQTSTASLSLCKQTSVVYRNNYKLCLY